MIHLGKNTTPRSLSCFFSYIPAILLTFSALTLIIVTISSQMLLPWISAILGAVLLALVVLAWVAMCYHPTSLRQLITSIACILFSFLFIIGSYFIQITVNTLRNITSGGIQSATMGVYVRSNDPSQLGDLLNSRFGVLENLDSFNTHAALMKIQEDHYVMVDTKGYASATQLVDALLQEEVAVILVNRAYLDAISELDGYTDVTSQLHEIAVYTIYEDDRTSMPDPVPLPSRKPKDNTFAVYISGSDSRTSDILATGRSDVNIIAVINPNTQQILLLSTPRDYYIPLSISNESDLPDKLTHAGIYGIDVSMDTLAQFYDMDIDYYFRVNFSGFQEIIDALGGIQVDCQLEFSSGGYHFQPGIINMDGEQALSYVRERYAFPNGDYQRGIHQMQVISAVMKKAMSPDMLKSYSDVLDAVSNCFISSVPYDLIGKMVSTQLLNEWNWNIVSYYVSGTGETEYTYSIPEDKAYVIIPDGETVEIAKELIRQVHNGEVLLAP